MERDDAVGDLLLGYASGALPEAISVLVATQLALRPELRRTVREIEQIGGHLLEEIEPAPLSATAFDAVLSRISANDDVDTEAEASGIADGETASVVPQPLRGYLGAPLSRLAWRKRGPGIEEYRVPVGDDRFEMSLIRIKPGRAVPDHSHEGSELTLVLDGAFSDETGHYGRGDLAVNGEEDHHSPLADPERGCICVAITGGPLRFSNPLVRFFDRMTRG
ncbi:ChrR family anti-sigma-E factor [Nisaea acidiphila]|uniref:ChrR family anti-sigma-E factor n=1 Tax=Nisaea acidiphila TaxID=1862145 RepID=A0A9J7AKZ0_9PROT|nr:ChrR family anti-sigma-E factor [Nisaea acidiphila]UUX48323.1 ChrR family anti-sigma-E factor [Nisaea acidiphila]